VNVITVEIRPDGPKGNLYAYLDDRIVKNPSPTGVAHLVLRRIRDSGRKTGVVAFNSTEPFSFSLRNGEILAGFHNLEETETGCWVEFDKAGGTGSTQSAPGIWRTERYVSRR
jgi:hypothetical protein